MRLITLKLEQNADIPRLRQVALAATKAAGFDTFAQTRIATALLELGRNTIVHGGGGRLTLSLMTDGPATAIKAIASDTGPGLPNPDDVSEQRADSVKAGLGLGLQGVQRIADRFSVDSDSTGARITVAFITQHPKEQLTELANTVGDTIAALSPADPAAALAQQNQELLLALSERDLLLQEVHHRTRNNLSLVNSLVRLSARSAKGEEAQRLLTDLSLRMEAVLSVHEQLERNDDGDGIALGPFLRNITARIQSAFSSNESKVDITVGGDDVSVGGRMGVDVGLIVGELVTNALKHAFVGRETGTITITLEDQKDPERLILSVCDDGPGLPDGMTRPDRKSSLGWRVVESMARRYNGRVDVVSESGLCVAIAFDDWRDEGT